MKLPRLLFTLALLVSITATARGETISVSAAVSLKESITQIAKDYEAQGGDHVEFTFGASGQLATQIKSGAPVDLFISAANKQIDELNKAGDLVDSSREIICGNEMVLIVPGSGPSTLHGFSDLSSSSVGKVCIGEPKTVPAGQYAMQVLDKLKLTSTLGDRLIYGSNVRQVLGYVENGDAAAGIVYATDAKEAGDKVKVIATADASNHEPIVYPAAIVKGSTKLPAAKNFLAYLLNDKAQAVLTTHGFSPAKSAAPATAPAATPATTPSAAPAK